MLLLLVVVLGPVLSVPSLPLLLLLVVVVGVVVVVVLLGVAL